MEHPVKIRVTLCLALLIMLIKEAYPQGQSDTLQNRTVSYIDQDIERHKWEANVNVISLFKLGVPNWPYNYLIKRNIGKGNGTGAVRFTVNPNLSRKDQMFIPKGFSFNDNTVTRFIPYVILGYERQKVMGRFVLFYGVDLGWRTEMAKFIRHDYKVVNSDGTTVTGELESKFTTNSAWIAPLVGGKYYLNHRFSLSIESQMRPTFSAYTTFSKFRGLLVYKDVLKGMDFETLGSYALNFSYNF